MGFISLGKIYNAKDYKFTYYKLAKLREHRESSNKKNNQGNGKSTKTKSHHHVHRAKSILERLPVELIYEIYTHSDLGGLNLTNKYFHRVLNLENNKYLVRKVIDNNVFRHEDQVIANIQILDYKFIDVEDLLPFEITRFQKIDRNINISDQIEDIEYDLPQRFYDITTENLAMIEYLLKKNLKIMDINQFVVNMIQSDTKIKKHNLRHFLKKQGSLKDIRTLVEILKCHKRKLRKWLISYYDADELRENDYLWRHHLSIEHVTLLKKLLWPSGYQG